MTTTTGNRVRKRQILTGMKYDRVDLVPDGANGHANILIAKNRSAKPRVITVRKAMGSVTCNECGTANVRKSATCSSCGSSNLQKTLVEVVKTIKNPKKVPKNDDAKNSTANASGFTFEDEQYDQDNGENGIALGGDSLEQEQPVNKSDWFDVVRKDSVDDVDNERFEHEKEGEDPDDDIEELSMRKPVGTRPDRRSGYVNGNNGTRDVMVGTAKSRKLKKEKPGLNSFDYGDQGSQEVAESAEQMYRAESQPTKQAQDRRESTLSDVFSKARRRRSNREGLSALDHGNSGIYQRPGVKRNGTNTGHKKTTNSGRTAVAPPGNPLDVGKSLRVRKNRELPTLEALNLGVGLAENIDRILKANRPDLYAAAMSEFIDHMNAAAGEWFNDSSVTKSKNTDTQAEDVLSRVVAIVKKASPAAEMSDEASEGENPNKVDAQRPKNTSNKMQNAGGDETGVGKSKGKVRKSIVDDPYAGLHPEVVEELKKSRELRELREQEVYLQKARELKNLPNFDAEKVAKQLRAAYDESQEDGDYLFQTLTAAANVAKDSTVFKQFGMTGVGSGLDESDPMARARAYADSHIAKAADGTTQEQLMAEYMRSHPGEFYQPAKQVA